MATKRTHGSGSIMKQKDGTYIVRLTRGKKENGKPNTKQRKANTRKEAEEKLKEIKKEFDQEERRMTVDFTDLTVPEYFERFIKYKSRTLKDTSLNRLESTVNTHIVPYFDFVLFSQLNSEDVQSRLDEMYEDGMSYSSIKKVYDAFNSCFTWAIEKQRDLAAEDNPMPRVEMVASRKFEKKKIRSFTNEEKRLFAEEATRKFKNGTYVHPMGPVFVFMLNTGIREGEMCAINREKHIDGDILHICDNAATVRNKSYTEDSRTEKKWITVINSYDTKTPEGQRDIPLNKAAQNMLQEILSIFPKISQHDLLIYGGNRGVYPPANMVKGFKNICHAAEIEDIEGYGPHVLRHTFATTLFSAGFDVKVISELMGHKDVTVTQNIYIDVIREQKAKAVEMIEIS